MPGDYNSNEQVLKRHLSQILFAVILVLSFSFRKGEKDGKNWN